MNINVFFRLRNFCPFHQNNKNEDEGNLLQKNVWVNILLKSNAVLDYLPYNLPSLKFIWVSKSSV